jgi:hypothetical protein
VSSFLSSLKADLLDRRLRAVLLALCLGLVAALVYALSGGSSEPPAPATASVPPPGASGISAVAAPVAGNQAIAETTSGGLVQRAGNSRDPFLPLPGSKAPASAAAPASSGAASSSQAAGKGVGQKGSESTSGSSGGSSSGPPSAGKVAPKKPKTVYHVAILFGIVPEGTPVQNAQLTPYTDLKLGRKLPSSTTPLLRFHEVAANGKRAVFEVTGEVLLKGAATCLPSPSQCQEISLAQGQSEEVEYLPAGGSHIVVYELQVVSITSSKAAASRARISLLHRLHVRTLAFAGASGSVATHG